MSKSANDFYQQALADVRQYADGKDHELSAYVCGNLSAVCRDLQAQIDELKKRQDTDIRKDW